MAKVADGDVREALEAIRAMLAGYAGQPNHMGDVYKIADAALERLTEQSERSPIEIAREAIAREKEADDAHHSAAAVRSGAWDDNHEVKDALRGVVAALRREPDPE